MILSIRHVGLEEAAIRQLEQAIFLWFHKDDKYVVSEASAIHTLALAVQGILWAYAHDSRQRPSPLTQRIEKLPPVERAKFRDAQNFFKHGSVGRLGKRKSVPHLPDMTDFFLADDVCTFNQLFGRSSGILYTFLFRYLLSFPKCGVRLKTLEMKLITSGSYLQAVAALDRIAFYQLVAPMAAANLREHFDASERVHLDGPP